MTTTKTAGNPRASSSRSLPPRQATHRPPIDHSDSDSAEDRRQYSVSPVASASDDVDQDYEADDPAQPFQEAPRVDLWSIKNEDFMMPRTSTDEHFRTLFQEDAYNHVFMHKQFAIHKYVNWNYLNEQTFGQLVWMEL